MNRTLPDINVLLALLDSGHVDHETAREWAEREIRYGWASCAITQNGFVRIITQPRYPSPVHPAQALERLARAASTDITNSGSVQSACLTVAPSTRSGSMARDKSPIRTCSRLPCPAKAVL